jgi:N utilization substance protein A
MRSSYDALMSLPGVGASTADALYEQGFYSIEELANASVEELVQIKGISDKKARGLLESAAQAAEVPDKDASAEAAEQDKPEETAGDAEDPGDTTVPEEET